MWCGAVLVVVCCGLKPGLFLHLHWPQLALVALPHLASNSAGDLNRGEGWRVVEEQLSKTVLATVCQKRCALTQKSISRGQVT